MDVLSVGGSLALYSLVAVCGVTLLVVWVLSERARRNAGFASKAQLRRQLSARSALKATEIRPSLRPDAPTSRTAPVSLTKSSSSRS